MRRGSFSGPKSLIGFKFIIMDAIKLSFTEKEPRHLNYPFRTIPAMKIAKLAVGQTIVKIQRGRNLYD